MSSTFSQEYNEDFKKWGKGDIYPNLGDYSARTQPSFEQAIKLR